MAPCGSPALTTPREGVGTAAVTPSGPAASPRAHWWLWGTEPSRWYLPQQGWWLLLHRGSPSSALCQPAPLCCGNTSVFKLSALVIDPNCRLESAPATCGPIEDAVANANESTPKGIVSVK